MPAMKDPPKGKCLALGEEKIYKLIMKQNLVIVFLLFYSGYRAVDLCAPSFAFSSSEVNWKTANRPVRHCGDALYSNRWPQTCDGSSS